jgi:hypothetical protein
MATVARVAQDFKCVSGSAMPLHTRRPRDHDLHESSFEIVGRSTSHEARKADP